ncbi:hypothetical protein ACVWZW_004293 [Bradyrhizobium sp. F1.13.4]
MHGGYGNFAILTGALIYALQDSDLAVEAHELRQASIDSILAVTEENATTKLAAITHAAANHDDNSAPGFLSHDVRLSSAVTTSGNGNVAEGALGQKGPGDAGDNLHKPDGADLGHDASIGVGGNVENVVYRFPIDSESNNSKSTSSDTVFDFASGPGRINLATFGALAWLHMTAASKSIPPHTLAWVYDSASNETIVYVNATDRILDIGDRGLLEIHLEGIVAVAEADVVSEPDGVAVATTLEQLEAALVQAVAPDETVLTKDNVQTSIEGSESSLGTAGAWALLANNGSGFHFGQTRTGLGTPTKFGSSNGPSADATEESDAASAASAHASPVQLAHSATAPAVANVTSTSGPINAGTGVSSTGPNEIGQPSVVTADNAGHGNSQHASEPGSAKDAATESTGAGSKPRAMTTAMAPSITPRLRRLHQGPRRENQRARNTANRGTQPLEARRPQPRSIRAQRVPAQETATRSTLRSLGLQRRHPRNPLKMGPKRATPPTVVPSTTLRLLTLRKHQRRRQNQRARNTANPGTQPPQTHRTQPRSIQASQRPPARATTTRSTHRSQGLQRRQLPNRLKLAPNRAMMAAMATIIIALRLLTPRKHQRRRQKQAARNTANPGTLPLQARRTEQRSIRAPQRPPAQATATRSTLQSQGLQKWHPPSRLKLTPSRATARAMAASITLRLRRLRGP